nr:MAG TPA_asm: adenylyltransferase domain protein [Caudoviricetes sp.]
MASSSRIFAPHLGHLALHIHDPLSSQNGC